MKCLCFSVLFLFCLERRAEEAVESMSLDKKYCLTVKEASAYFGIGEKKLRQMINENTKADYLICNGSKYLIKRKLFENLVDGTYSI